MIHRLLKIKFNLLPAFFVMLLLFECSKTTAFKKDAARAEEGLNFIENKGQWNAAARFKADLPDGAVFVTDKGLVYNFRNASDLSACQLKSGQHAGQFPQMDTAEKYIRGHAYKVNFLGSDFSGDYVSMDKRNYYHNYFIGKDATKWAGGVGVFGRVVQKSIYPGVDLALYSLGTALKYDFLVAPGADPKQIVLQFEGVQPMLSNDGNLKIKTSVNEVIERAPYVYQIIDGQTTSVPCRYKFAKGQLTFELLSGYNPDYTLVIDPVLVFCTYSGKLNGEALANATTHDQLGNLYAGAFLTKEPQFTDVAWPTTAGAYQTKFDGFQGVGINKYNSSGSALLYSTYYGGLGITAVHAMIVNNDNELIIAGHTISPNLPITKGCYDSSFNGGTGRNLAGPTDLFIARFSTAGDQLLGATYIGGAKSEGNIEIPALAAGTVSPMELALSKSGDIWLVTTTNSVDFPITSNAFQPANSGGYDGLIFALNADCSQLLYGSYLGGTRSDGCFNAVMNAEDNLVVCGITTSKDFPVMLGALHNKAPGGSSDGFVACINSQTGDLMHATYLGTSDMDKAYRIQTDAQNNVFVWGTTDGNYPVSPNVYHVAGGASFIDKLSPDLTQSLLSTRFGGMIPSAFLHDICGNTYVTGFNAPPGMPLTPDAYDTIAKSFWFGVFKPDFSDLHYASYFGSGSLDHAEYGIHRFDKNGIVYQAICSNSDTFPTTPNAVYPLKRNHTGYVDNLSFKFDFQLPIVYAAFELPDGLNDSGCIPYTVQFINRSRFAKEITWDFGDGSSLSHDISGLYTYTKAGNYIVSLYIYNDTTCNIADTFYMKMDVFPVELPDIVVSDTLICNAAEAVDINLIINNPNNNQSILWSGDGILSALDQPLVRIDPRVNTLLYVTVKDSIRDICGFSVTDTVHVDYAPRVLDILNNDTVVCEGAEIYLESQITEGYSLIWTPTTGLSDSTIANPIITIHEPNVYVVTASYPKCPDTSAVIEIGMQQYPVIKLDLEKVVCQGAPVALEPAIIPYRNDYHYQWIPEDLGLPQHPNISVIAEASLVYSLIVQTPIGCSDTASIQLTVIPGDFGSIIADTGYCPPDTVQLWANGGTSYLWSPSYGLNDTSIANPQAHPLTPTKYKVLIKEQHGCLDSLEVSIDVWPLAALNIEDSINLYPGEEYHLQPGTNCHYFHWFPPSGISSTEVADPWLSPEVRTRYFVTAVTEHGCTLKDSIDVLVNCTVMAMPNAFMPASASNNTFKAAIRGITELKHFMIFNRWGNKVFETNNISEGWDGTFKGQAQPVGVYVYSIEATSECGLPYYKEGNVTLLR